MSGKANTNKKFIGSWVRHMMCVLLIFLMAGCSGDAPQSATNNDNNNNAAADASGTGSVSFSVQWQTDNATVLKSAGPITKSAKADCTGLGIQSITCKVYDQSKKLVASGGPWDCEEGHADMVRIPAGSEMTFTILGWDAKLDSDVAEGNIIYQGSSPPNITVEAGEYTDAGTITAKPFLPTALKATAVSSDRIDLVWDDMDVAGYRIYQAGNVVATHTSPAFSVTNLAPTAQHCFTVSAIDNFDNESGQSTQACATTGIIDTEPPQPPLDPMAVGVSDTQIDITWTAPTDNVGVTGYRVYQKGNQDIELGRPETTTFSHRDLQYNTQYCYTVAAVDAANLMSQQSVEVCARTRDIVVWYRDGDQDRFGDEKAPIVVVEGQQAPEGYVRDNTDCNDAFPTIHPGAVEMCNNVDDNCINGPDEACTQTPTASFTTRLATPNDEVAVLFGDAQGQEGNAFNSETLVITEGSSYNVKPSDRVGLEFDITYPLEIPNPPANRRVTLEVEANYEGTGQGAWVYVDGYHANGMANAADYDPSELITTNRYFYVANSPGAQTHSVIVSTDFDRVRERNGTQMGILLRMIINSDASIQITNPKITVVQN